MPHTFLFDLDGTLIDSIDLIRLSYEHALRSRLGVVLSRDEFVAGLGRPLAWQFRRHTDDAAEIEALVATYRAHNLAHHDALVRPFPGVREALGALRQRGGRIGVVTSKMRAGAGRGLARCELTALVDVLVGVDDVARAKPEPEPVLRALELLGAPAAGAIYAGDSPHDIAAGRAAGVRTAAVLWGPSTREELARAAPDHWLAQPADIAGLADLA